MRTFGVLRKRSHYLDKMPSFHNNRKCFHESMEDFFGQKLLHGGDL